MSTTITVHEDGSIDGYLTVEEFAKKHGTTAATIRQEIHTSPKKRNELVEQYLRKED